MADTCLCLKSGRKIKYATEATVRRCMLEKGFSDVDTLAGTSNSDLKSGVYEGGLKIWEGSIDLCNYIDSNLRPEGKRFLELGCGAALPTILALLKGASFAVVNDFNDFVLECFCRENFYLNDISSDDWYSVAGSWSDLIQKTTQIECEAMRSKSFDFIITAETLYNPQYYENLHAVFDRFLTEDGQILLAAKVYYFGLNASITDFMEFVAKNAIFECADVWTSSEEGIPRKIIRLTRLKK